MVRKSNKWLLLICAVVVVVFVVVVLKPNGVKHEGMVEIPVPEDDPTGDTTADTVSTLTATVEQVEESNQELIVINEDLARENKRREQLVDKINSKQSSVDDSLAKLIESSRDDEQKISDLTRELSQMRELLTAVNASSEEDSENGIPVGFGYDDDTFNETLFSDGSWVAPIDAVSDEDGKGFGVLSGSGSGGQTQQVNTDTGKKPDKLRYLTAAKNSTGFDSIAFTALVGRIPVKGSLPDPYKFKLIMGKENMIANGLTLPDVEGMIWSGVARGDWNLRCVGGDLYSVTFVFVDGTILTQSAEEGEEPLGWISDEFGFPCIDGQFVTNAPAFLAQRTGLAALTIAGEAYAEAQRTTRDSLLGTQSFISGSTGKYVLGESVSAATNEVSAWLLERQQQSFDAVVADAGVRVGIHIDIPIEIDYKIDGRKIRHDTNKVSAINTLP